ncbi:MAG: GlcG/HbpS family heme-binding protein [Pseudolabrys sp.]
MRSFVTVVSALAIALMAATAASAQAPAAAPPPMPGVGAPLTLEQAKKIVAAAEAEAKKNNWAMVIAIVEPNGQLVYLQKADGTQYGSINVAIDKAVSSALFRRPTTAFEAGLKAGNTYLLTLRGANATPGGQPIVMGGKVVGGIGVSGATGAQDDQVAKAGLAAAQ